MVQAFSWTSLPALHPLAAGFPGTSQPPPAFRELTGQKVLPYQTVKVFSACLSPVPAHYGIRKCMKKGWRAGPASWLHLLNGHGAVKLSLFPAMLDVFPAFNPFFTPLLV